jgi:threonylcarbamoyladenosine tRNA methylthiotransferase MtaB
MYKIAFETFGCRLNQAETATLSRQFLARGYEVTDDPLTADLYVVNTCNLTSQATSKCRRKIRSVIRRNPDACVAAIGCYAQTDADNLREIEGLDYIVGTADKLRLAELIPEPVKLPEAQVVNSRPDRDTFTIETTGYYPWNTRANIKIQEGCDFVCAFCIVPRSRGRARSREFDDILRETRALVDAGHREIVITGVNIGTYRDGRYTMADVLSAMADVDGLDRIRLSSIEPTTIQDEVVAQMAGGGKLCPYMHVPAQSGDDGVLAAMRRRYDTAEFRGFIEDAIARVPGLGLGTDIIVGFPGESETAYRNSRELMASLPWTNIHVFSFSSRPRTSAHNMPDKLTKETIRERSEEMHRIADRKKAEFYGNQEGRVLRTLFEEQDSAGNWLGFTDNYTKVAVSGEKELSNQLLPVRITGLLHTGKAGSSASLVATGVLAPPGDGSS